MREIKCFAIHSFSFLTFLLFLKKFVFVFIKLNLFFLKKTFLHQFVLEQMFPKFFHLGFISFQASDKLL